MTTDPRAALREAAQDVVDWIDAEVAYPRPDPHPGMAMQSARLRAALAATPPAIDVEAERAYVNNYISGRDAALRSALIARVGDAVGRNAAADIVDAAWRAALADTDA